jgi:tRNA(fMet)-specific endonuclease VapC
MIQMLDTDSFVLLVRGTSIKRADSPRKVAVKASAARILARCKKQAAAGDVIALSAISAAELEYGLRHSGGYPDHAPALRRLMAPFTVFPFDATDCVHHYGIVRSELETKGLGIGPLDTLIAAQALALGAVLVTHNTREFGRVPKLVIEDWA